MSLTVRGLLARCKIFRPDILDAQVTECISEAVKRVSRQTWLSKETLAVSALSAQTKTISITPTLGSFINLERVSLANIPSSGTVADYIGTYDATDGSVDPVNGAFVIEDDSASDFTTNAFYICSTAGSLLPDSVDLDSEVGDIMYSDGTQWNLIKVNQFTEISIVNSTNSMTLSGMNSRYGTPSACSCDDGILKLYPVPESDNAISIEVSYVPDSFVSGNIPLPNSCEDAIVSAALEMLYAIPGEHINLSMSQVKGRDALVRIANLFMKNRLGQTGMPEIKDVNFTGRW